MLANFGFSASTLSTYPLRTVRPITKEMLAATAALTKQVAVPGSVPNRYLKRRENQTNIADQFRNIEFAKVGYSHE